MAKLNKMEISAIAESIAIKAKESVKEYNNSLKTDEAKEKWKNEFKNTVAHKALLKLNNSINEFNIAFKGIKRKYGYSISYTTIDVVDLLEDIFEYEMKCKSETIDKASIERDIIISQAKNEDLDKLIEELTKKYSV